MKTNFRTDIIKYRVGKLKYILENKDPLMSIEDYSGWTCRISIEHWTTFFFGLTVDKCDTRFLTCARDLSLTLLQYDVSVEYEFGEADFDCTW